MIFVTLGTQDKSFKRLLDKVSECIDLGLIKDEVIVQAGCTNYPSDKMKIFDYLDKSEMEKYIKKAKYIITHGGVGTIINCLDLNKKVIAVARLKEYGEHHNDHQLEIINEFSNDGYIINGEDLSNAIKKVDLFKPKKYVSNNKNFVKLITNYIDNN